MTYFPMHIEMENESEGMIVSSPTSVPQGRSFVVRKLKIKQAEKNVKRIARLLDAIDLSRHEGKFVTFDGKRYFVSDTFAEAMETGNDRFGEDTAFVVRKAGSSPTLSSLVK